MDFLNKMRDIHSFVLLQEIFESWVNEGVIKEKTAELKLGYASLIAYPSIYLTKDGAEQEISAAKICYEILMKYVKDKIKEDLNSDNEKTKLATAIMTLPPEKYILTVCSEFFNLHYFLKGLYPNCTDEQLANINGDELELSNVVAASGAKFAGILNDTIVVLWNKGENWTLILDDDTIIECESK